MGKASLIIVLGMSVIVSFIILRLNANSKENLSTTVNMFEQTTARQIANSGIEIFLEKLKADMTMNGHTYSDNQLFGGTYDITFSGPDTAIMVTSRSTFMGVNHKSIAIVQADRLPDFDPNSSLYVSSETMNSIKINGNITIDGFNHDLAGTRLNDGNEVPGIAVDMPEQVQQIIDNIGGEAVVDGLGGKPSVRVAETFFDWEQYALDVESNPDIIINSEDDLKNYSNLGTESFPKTTFINGDIHITSLTGCGILVINGNVIINSNFTYKGLIISHEDTDITTQFNGNGLVIGAMVVAGMNANLQIANGTYECLYSQEALILVNNLLKTRRFEVLSWWE
jgi:hypothetical protein